MPSFAVVVGVLSSLAFSYSVYCWAMILALKVWGRSARGKFLREYRKTRRRRSKGEVTHTKCFDIGYSVDGRDYETTVKRQEYTFTIGLGALRRAVMKGVRVYYFPKWPHRGYVLREFVASGVSGIIAAMLVLTFFYVQRG